MSDASPVPECVLLTRTPYAAHADLRRMLRESGQRVTVLSDAHEAFAYLCTRQRGRRAHLAEPSRGLMLVVDELDAMTMGLVRASVSRYLPGASLWQWDGGTLIPLIEGGSAEDDSAPPSIETASGIQGDSDEEEAERIPVSGDELEMLLGPSDDGDGHPDDADGPDGPTGGESDSEARIGSNEPGGAAGRRGDGGSSSS